MTKSIILGGLAALSLTLSFGAMTAPASAAPSYTPRHTRVVSPYHRPYCRMVYIRGEGFVRYCA